MAFFFKSIAEARCSRRQPHRTLFDLSAIKCVRDRALDHVVERERNLKPAINLKNLIISHPSNSLPLTTIADNRRSLQILTRPIDFIRSYPSIFQEFLPDATAVIPHVRLTPEAADLDSEEKLMYQSDSYKQQVADRLVKLLMLNRNHKVPLSLVDRMRWDLGLPDDYLETVIPHFPDYFHIVGYGGDRFLELVCWIDELAVSAVEKNAMKDERDGLYLGEYMKGMPFEFQMEYSSDFEMDKKYKKWLDNWQKLPYISPYQNASHISSSSDESDKWAVAVLHELLHILVPKKSEKDDLLCFAEYMDLRPRIKRAMLHHPGIFYMSSKLGTHMIVLREAYKRNILIEKHVLISMRSQYIHLMNSVKHVAKKQISDQKKQQIARDVENANGQQVQDDEDSDSLYWSSSTIDHDAGEFEVGDSDDDDDIDEETQVKKQTGRNYIKTALENEKSIKKLEQKKYSQVSSNRHKRSNHVESSRRFENDRVNNSYGRSREGFISTLSRQQKCWGTGNHSDGTRTTPSRSKLMSLRGGSERLSNVNLKSSRWSVLDRHGPLHTKTGSQTGVDLRMSRRASSPRSRGSSASEGIERCTNMGIGSNSTRGKPSQEARTSAQ
uniref:PORR domain-containing protein n=1 Tax=Kalanchoe fedtschenkoi TaxID=63787 RepID=A0A7N0TL73_KALFE